MEYKRQQGVILAFLVFVAISYAEYVPSVKQASLNYPYNDTILPCTTQYYSYSNINGGAQTYLKATYQEWSSTGQTVNFALYYQTYDSAPIITNSCQSPCNLTFYCGFQSGSYYLGLTTPSTSNTQNMSYAVGLYSYSVNINSQNVPFSYNAINSQQQGGDDPMTVDHYQINVGTVSVHSELVVAVTGISGGNSLSLCLNDGVLSNSPSGGQACCPMSNTSVNGQDFQILVGSCMLQSDSTFYASVQVPSGNIANYTIAASINPTPINSIALPYKGTGVLNPNDIIYYGFNFNGQEDEELLVTLTGIYGGSAEIFVNATNLPGPKSCTGASYKSCVSDDVCTFTVQPCALTEGAWYVAITGTSFSKQQIQYAVELSTQSITPTIVSLGTVDRAVYTDNIGEDQYDHYRLTVTPSQLQDDSVLYVYLYVNFDKAPLTLFMNYASAAGLGACYQNLMNCSTSGSNPSEPTTCHFTLQRCNLTTGDYYFSVYGDASDTYGTGVSYTLSFQLTNSVALQNATSISQTVWAAEYSHYHIDLAQSAYLPGQKLHVKISDVSNGEVVAYLNHNELAGDCPCYTWISYCNQTGPELDCTLDVTYCAFTYGSWYIGVYGENPMDSTLPIGFTIAAFIDAPPTVTNIGINSTTNGLISQVQENFFMFTAPQTTSQELVVDLVITHHTGDEANPQLNLYMQTQNLADPTCYQYTCSASKLSNSYCTIVFDPCVFASGSWSITITGVGNDTTNDIHYTLTVTTRDVTPSALQNGVSVADQVLNEQYNEYYFSTSGLQSYPTVVVDVYVSQNVNPLTIFTNLNNPAGGLPCYGNNGYVITNTSVQFVYPTCLIPANSNFYFGAYGGDALFYQQPIQYTITANVQYPTLLDGTGYPVTGHVTPGNTNHYYLSVQDNPLGQVLQVSVHNIKGGSLTTFFNFGEPAGSCPCYQSQYSFEGEFDYTNYFCNFQAGNYYIGVQGETATSAFVPVSYVLKAQYVQQPTGSLSLNTAQTGVVSYNVLNTYKLNLGSVPSSSSLQVTLSNIISNGDNQGNISLYISSGQPGSPSCNNAFTCSASTGSNQGCTVQLNSCAFSPSGNWYVTVYGALVNKTATVNFTLNANISSPTAVPMSQPYNDQIGAGSSKFYYLTSGANLNNNQVFQIFLYNLSQSSALTLYVNPSSPAGTGCYNFAYNCSTSFTDSCVVTIPPCSISGGSTYYFTVWSASSSVSYTVAANITTISSTNSLALNQQASGTNLQPNTYTTYTIQVGNVAAQSALLITTQIQQGSLSVFTSFGSIPLNAPCYQNLCEGTSGQTCEFYVPACCLQSGTYYTTIYNRYGNTLAGSFQISNVLYPGNNTISLSFGSNNTINSGVAQNQAQFYSTSVSIQQYSSVLLSISATGSSLDTYVQKNTVAGNSGCYSSWFSCQRQVSNNNPCVVQVPPCAVSNGDQWYITLNNTGSTNYPGYSVATQEQRIRTLTLAVPYNDSVISNTYNHYQFSWNGPSGYSTFTTSVLNFTLNVYNNAQATMYINFGSPAGGPSNNPVAQLNCLTNMYTCQASAANNYQCVVTIPTCQTAKGTYFVSVFGSSQTSNSNYSVTASQQQTGNVGTLNTNQATTYNGNQLLTLNTGNIQNNQYLVINVTNVTSSGASVTVTLWPSCDCFASGLQCTATSNSPCQIFFDPCTFVGGSYNINITTNGNYNYTLTADIQGSVNPLQTLQLDTPYSDVLGPYQYQFYSIDTGMTDGTESVTFTVNANCGKVDFFLSTSAPASAACNEYSCIGQSSCSFTIPSCDYFGGKFYLTTHIADPTYMTFHDQIWVPVVYDISVTKLGWNITDVMTHDTVVMSTGQQLRVHVDTLSIGTQLYFSAESSTQEITLYVSPNMIIGGQGCEEALNVTCQQNTQCLIAINPCTFTPGYYYVTVSGANVTVTSYYEAKYIPIVTDGNWTGSVAPGQYQYYRIPVDVTQDGLQFSVQVNNISGGEVEIFLIEDDFGRVAASGCSMYSCNPTDQDCEIQIDGCAVGNNYYLGVYGSNLAGCVITYTLSVTQTVELQLLPVNTLVCGTVEPGVTTYYQLSVPQGTSLFASYLNIILSDATEPVEVNWYNDFVPGSSCSAASCNGTNCEIVVCHPTNVYIAVTSLSAQQSNYQIEAILTSPNVIAINAGSTFYTGSGTTYYSYTSSTYSPVIATANFNGELYVDNGFLAVPQCAAYSCTSSSGCNINTLCEGDNSGETFYFTVEAAGSFSFNVQSPVSETTPLTTSPVNGNAGPEVSYYSYKNQVTGEAALDFVFTSIYGGSITVYASLGVYPTPECAEYNVTISQAQQTGFLSIPACELVYGATYYIAVYGEPTYSCSDVSFTAQATPVVSTNAVSIDATSGYKVSISQTSTVIYQLNNVNPSGEQYVHVTATGVTGGEVTVTLYTNTIGSSCADMNCTTSSSCYVTVPCANSNTYFAVVSAVVTGCEALSFTLTATATNYIGLTPSVTSFSITNNDMFYAAVSVTSPNSIVFHTELVSGNTMQVTIWEDSCLSEMWARVDCVYGAQCNVSIPTRAQHNGNSRWYITGQGAPGTNFKMWVTGGYGGNCAQPQFATGAFCSSIVNYNTWIYENITAKDEEAYNRYLWLTEHFTCGQTDACHQALQTFSCYESFPACDQQGFIVGSCISACTDVEASCGEFCEYGLPQYSCLSDRYISSGFCTGTGPIVTTTGETTVSTAVITTGSSSSTSGSSSSSSTTSDASSVQVISYAVLAVASLLAILLA